MKRCSDDLNELLKEYPFLNVWVSSSRFSGSGKTVAAILKRFSRAEVISGFGRVDEFHDKVTLLAQEISLLTKQHDSRLAAIKSREGV